MKTFLTLIFLLLSFSIFSQNLASQDILLNTFMIKTESGTLSAFLVEVKGQEYLISARHGFRKHQKSGTKVSLEVMLDRKFTKESATFYTYSDTSIDIAAIRLTRNIKRIAPPQISKGDFFIGQTCMFFGYPYGSFYTDADLSYIPFVKKGVISAFNEQIVFLDGINNPGFSGGPVLVQNDSTKEKKIIAVISGYHPEFNLVSDKQKHKIDSLRYYTNSGIIYSYRIGKLEEILPK